MSHMDTQAVLYTQSSLLFLNLVAIPEIEKIEESAKNNIATDWIEKRTAFNESYSYNTSYHSHNRRAGADTEEHNFGNNPAPVSSASFENTKQSDAYGGTAIRQTTSPDLPAKETTIIEITEAASLAISQGVWTQEIIPREAWAHSALIENENGTGIGAVIEIDTGGKENVKEVEIGTGTKDTSDGARREYANGIESHPIDLSKQIPTDPEVEIENTMRRIYIDVSFTEICAESHPTMMAVIITCVSLTPERRSSSVESTRYPGRQRSTQQSHSRSRGDFDSSRQPSRTRQSSTSTEHSSHEKSLPYHDPFKAQPAVGKETHKTPIQHEIVGENRSNQRKNDNIEALCDQAMRTASAPRKNDTSVDPEHTKINEPCQLQASEAPVDNLLTDTLVTEGNALKAETATLDEVQVENRVIAKVMKQEVLPTETRSDEPVGNPLTTEKIFAMIDRIDSEIGHYEALLDKIRKNKQSHAASKSYVKETPELREKEYTDPAEPNEGELVVGVPDISHPTSAVSTSSTDELQHGRKPSLYQQIYAENRTLVKSNVKPSLGPVYKNVEDYPFYTENIETHQRIRKLIFTHLRLKASTLEKKESRLRQEYKEHLEDWRIRIIKLDKKRERKRGKRFMEDELLTSNANGISARSQRRGGFYNADAVRSEAELMEIIQYLEHEDLRNPDVRSVRTAATIPPMILDPNKRELAKYDNRNNLVEDPYNYYHCDTSVDHWTNEEREIFIKKYLLYPKQFGKIASFLKHKNPQQCVLFYYREKKSIDFKGLISGRGKKRRQLVRKGTGKRTERSKKSKGNALLQDIDEAERSIHISEDQPDSLPPPEKRRSKGFDDESIFPESQKPRRKPRTKQRQHPLPDNDEERRRKPSPPQSSPATARWSEEDRHVALQAYKKYGQDFYSVSKVVGSKTEEQCRNFYYNFRRKHGMSALEAPLEMTTEYSQSSSLLNDHSASKLDRRHKTSTESLKADSRQQKIKRRSSEVLPTGNPSIADDLGHNGSVIEASVAPEPTVKKSRVSSPIDFQLDSMPQPRSHEAVAPSSESTLHPPAPPNPPSESFLELLVQAACGQDAELSRNTALNTSTVGVSTSKQPLPPSTSPELVQTTLSNPAVDAAKMPMDDNQSLRKAAGFEPINPKKQISGAVDALSLLNMASRAL
ncbi:hypothetical protein K493DRAFT_358417 [Basidiobolus meristosporus CBS 931.73]|uniref:SANT domain-containing protein n=1 Tax=Basidiobolus meristosporus CBS 931.73 TaxID=1314790 RepID=A0A1Y1XUU3_9FUNG|nr:hypothetical protein K493DRAFT_358417 [Basidiobolus meristosporus CBS 931.73]|eukprot:ORX89256.1 hypothetical protein K493DRAFT_358417 [Basidiobolus meristosporus CBS 931.73]